MKRKAIDFDYVEEIKEIRAILQEIKTTMAAATVASSSTPSTQGKHAKTAILNSQQRLIKIKQDLKHIHQTLDRYAVKGTRPTNKREPTEVK